MGRNFVVKFKRLIKKFEAEINALYLAHKIYAIIFWLISLVIEGVVYMIEWVGHKHTIGILLVLFNAQIAYWLFKPKPKPKNVVSASKINNIIPVIAEKEIEEENKFITLKEAAHILYEQHPIPDEFIADINPAPERDTLGDMFFERDNPNVHQWENLHWKDKCLIGILKRFFKKGMLNLYGEHYPSTKIERVPLNAMDNWGDDFASLYSDNNRTVVKYVNLKCDFFELLEFIKSHKEGALSSESLKALTEGARLTTVNF
jgi:hypothetical protein